MIYYIFQLLGLMDPAERVVSTPIIKKNEQNYYRPLQGSTKLENVNYICKIDKNQFKRCNNQDKVVTPFSLNNPYTIIFKGNQLNKYYNIHNIVLPFSLNNPKDNEIEIEINLFNSCNDIDIEVLSSRLKNPKEIEFKGGNNQDKKSLHSISNNSKEIEINIYDNLHKLLLNLKIINLKDLKNLKDVTFYIK